MDENTGLWCCIGFVVLFVMFLVAQYAEQKSTEERWKRNVSPHVVPGPLKITDTAYKNAKEAIAENAPVALLAHNQASIFAGSLGFETYSDFDPAEIITRFILAYNFQAKMNNYPTSLFFPVRTGLADQSKWDEYLKDVLKNSSISEYHSTQEMLEIGARGLLNKTDGMGSSFKVELRDLMDRTNNHPQVCKFVSSFCQNLKLQEFATERLVKEGKVKDEVSEV
jgi:hypothetical protein